MEQRDAKKEGRVQPVIFDLDGTLTDSAPIIASCFAEVEREMRGIDRPVEDYLWCCGPPLALSFTELGWVDLEAAVAAYRAKYTERMGATRLFAGAGEMLESLAADGFPIALATSKLEHMADWMLRHLGVREHFALVCGAGEGERHAGKAHIVARAVAGLRQAGAVGEPVMVGDRRYDVEGAKANGIRAVACRWGGAEESEFADAWRVVSTFEELEELLRGA